MNSSNDPVIDWLLDADPSIGWQVMRDLTDMPAEMVAAARRSISRASSAAQVVDRQHH